MSDTVKNDESVVVPRRSMVRRKTAGEDLLAADGSAYKRESRATKSAFLRSLRESQDPHRGINIMNRASIDMRNVPDGVEAKWVRTSLRGRSDTANLAEAASDGWRFTPPEFHPERLARDMFGNIQINNSMITEGDVGLAYRPKEIGEQQRYAYKKLTYDLTKVIPIRDGFVTQSGHRTNMHFSQQKMSDRPEETYKG